MKAKQTEKCKNKSFLSFKKSKNKRHEKNHHRNRIATFNHSRNVLIFNIKPSSFVFRLVNKNGFVIQKIQNFRTLESNPFRNRIQTCSATKIQVKLITTQKNQINKNKSGKNNKNRLEILKHTQRYKFGTKLLFL